MDFDKNGGEQYRRCEICSRAKYCTQHHIERGFGRKTSKVMWICFECHRKIHDNPQWAYEKGYQIRHDFTFKPITMKEEKKKKACSHSKSYFDARLGYIKCQYCGQKVESINFGTKKPKKDATAPKSANKMGYEEVDPRIKKAEKLKMQLKAAISASKKNAGDKEKWEFWQEEIKRIKGEMRSLQSSYED